MKEHMIVQNADLTLSDLYEASLPAEGAVLVPKRPSGCSKYKDGEDVLPFYRNDLSLPLFEELFAHPYDHVTLTKLNPVSQMPFAGPRLEIVSDYIPSKVLQNHWVQFLGSERYRPKFCGLGEDKVHFVYFPMKAVKPNRHVIHPETLHHMFTKEFIATVDCPQAPLYAKNNVQFPCIVKTSLSQGARAVYKCINAKQFKEVVELHEKQKIPYIINKMIDIQEEYCVQFSVNKKGHCTMVGATKPIFNQEGIWEGSMLDFEKQQSLRDRFRDTVEPVSAKLQSLGFFGFVGCDVIVDKDGKHYVVDINPRLNGSTPLLLASFKLAQRGWKFGMLLKQCLTYEGSEQEFIELCEAEKGERGEVFVNACGRKDDNSPLRTILQIYSTSEEECWNVFHNLCAKCEEQKGRADSGFEEA